MQIIRQEVGRPTWAKQKVAVPLLKLFLAMKSAKDVTILAEQGGICDAQYEKLVKRYDRIIKTACRENPAIPGRKGCSKRGKVFALIDRLRKYKEAVCLFVKNLAVPFDNNQTKCDLRMVKTKVSDCFRTEAGCRELLNILVYTSTVKKHNANPFYAILLAVKGQPCIAWT